MALIVMAYRVMAHAVMACQDDTGSITVNEFMQVLWPCIFFILFFVWRFIVGREFFFKSYMAGSLTRTMSHGVDVFVAMAQRPRLWLNGHGYGSTGHGYGSTATAVARRSRPWLDCPLRSTVADDAASAPPVFF